jgi:hypothetical protein
MNHRVNAIVHALPACPECFAPSLYPCADMRGVCEPHRIRLRVKRGEVFVIERTVAKAKRKLRVLEALTSVGERRRP